MPSCLICGEEVRRNDEYLTHLKKHNSCKGLKLFNEMESKNITCHICHNEQNGLAGLISHVENYHQMNDAEESKIICSEAKHNENSLNTNNNSEVENSSKTRVADKRDATSRILQKLAGMVPYVSEEVLDEILDGAESMLALAHHPTSGELLPSFAQIGEERKKRSKLTEKQGVGTNDNEATEKMMLTIEDLPEEVLLEAMSYLNLIDRKNARLVCKQWHRLSYDKKLISKDWTNIVPSFHLNHAPNSKHINVKVYKSNNLNPSLFWEKHGKHVESIEFRYIEGDCQAISQVLRCCPNVKQISLSLTKADSDDSDDSLPVVPLKHLERLEFTRSCHVTDKIAALFKQAPKLKEIVTSSYEALEAVMELIASHSSTLEELDLRFLMLNTTLPSIVDNVGAQLARLHLGGALSLNDSCLYGIVNKFVNLQHLNLEFTRFSIPAYEFAITSLKSLTHLSLRCINLSGVPQSFFTAIDNWTHLIAIDLSYTRLRVDNLEAAFRSPHPKLTHLKIDLGQTDCSTDLLNRMCQSFPNLLALELDGLVTEDALRIIATHCTQLQEFWHSKGCGWPCQPTILNSLENLKHLSLPELMNCAGLVRALSLSKLHTIDLRHTETTSEDILKLLENNRSLHCVGVSNDDQMAPIYNNVINIEIRRILLHRRPNHSCERRTNIFQSHRLEDSNESC